MRAESRLRIATIGSGNEINLTPMTFGWAGGRVYIFGRGQKIANLRRRSAATVLVDTGERWRDLKGIMMIGAARVLESAEDEAADDHLGSAQLNLGEKQKIEHWYPIRLFRGQSLLEKRQAFHTWTIHDGWVWLS